MATARAQGTIEGSCRIASEAAQGRNENDDKVRIAIFVVASESLVTMNVVTAIMAGMVGSDALGTRRPHTQGRPNETRGLRHDDVFGEAAAGTHPQHRLRHVYLPLGQPRTCYEKLSLESH